MALINIAPTQTAAQKAAHRIRASANRLHTLMLASHQEIFNALWNTDGVDPQDVLDVLDTDATTLFEAGALAVQIILTQDPTALDPAQYQPERVPTFNPGGTVTLAP